MFKLFFYSEDKFNFKALFTTVTTVLSGFAAAGIAIIVNEVAGEILEGRVHLKHLPFFLADAIFLVVLRKVSLIQGIELVESILETLRNKISNEIRQVELIQMENIDKGEIYGKIAINTQIISRSARSFIKFMDSYINLFIIFIYIFYLSITIGIIVIVLFSIGLMYHNWSRPLLEEKFLKTLEKETELFEKFRQSLDGFRELKINDYKKDDIFENYLKPVNIEVENFRIESGELISKYDAILHIFLFYLSIGCVMFLLPVSFSIEIKFRVIAVLVYLWGPIGNITLLVPEILRAKEAAQDLINFEQEFKSKYEIFEFAFDPDMEIIDHFDELRIEQLCFNYTDKEEKPIFSVGPLDMILKSGEIIFLTGGNGSGKSTLLKLITGLYEPLSGTFIIDGIEIHILDHRSLFSVVYTDCHLFDRLYGIEEDVSDEKVNNMLHLMFLDHKIRWENKKFIYNELSTGQMKRLALIFALLEDKQIYVFDEWAAEQDPGFRKYFYEELLPDMKSKGKTIIAATHDDRYFHIADRIINMEYGKII